MPNTRRRARGPAALASTWLTALLLAAAGCDDDDGPASPRDSSAPVDATDGPGADAGAPPADASANASADSGDAVTAAAPGPSADPLPPGGAPHRIFGAEVVLNGDERSSCSTPVWPAQITPATQPSVWCSFSRPGRGAGVVDLWVLDIVAASVGPVPCDGSHPACRKVMEKIWTGMPLGGPSHPFAHAFDGQTLLIYGDAPPNDKALHAGPIYAWRPNFPAPRQLTSDKGLLCQGSNGGNNVHCLDDVMGRLEMPDSVLLRAGAVADFESPLLPTITRFRPHRSDGVSAWRAEFSPDGSTFFFSSPDPDPAIAVLRWVWTSRTDNPAIKDVVSDVGAWRLGAGETLYFMNRIAAGGTGPLSRLTIPGHLTEPGAPAKIADAVHGFDLHPGAALGRVTVDRDGITGRGLDLLEADPAMAKRLFDFPQTPESVRLSDDAVHTAWISYDFVGELVRNADLTRCALATNPLSEVFSAGFVGTDLVQWSEGAGLDQERSDGFTAPRDNCRAAVRYAMGLHRVQKSSTRGIVFTDNFDDDTFTVTLKFARAVAAAPGVPAHLGPAVVVAEKINQYVTIVGDDDAQYALYRATAASAPLLPGIYLYGPIKFDQAPAGP